MPRLAGGRMSDNSTFSSQIASNSQEPLAGSSSEPIPLPYRPSWVNRLIDSIKRLPFPSWLFYTILFAVLTATLLVSNWIEGTTSFGRFDSPFIYTWNAFYLVVFLASIHYLDGIALSSFETFLPALGMNETEVARLRFELTTLPAGPAWIVAVLGATFFGVVLFLENNYEFARGFPLTFVLTVFYSVPGFIMTAEMLYHTFRQLRLVNQIHNAATAIDLHDPNPLYAFSNLSARTGSIFLFVLSFDLIFNPETFTNLGLAFMNLIGLGLFAVACFILPLLGMHRTLLREKQRMLLEVNQRIKAVFKQLYQQVDKTEFHDVDPLNKTINSLIIAHDFVVKIPTWPWKPGTFTLFFTAFTFPIFVFVIQMFLQKLLDIN